MGKEEIRPKREIEKRRGEGFFGLIRRKKRRTGWKREEKVDEEDSGKKREDIY